MTDPPKTMTDPPKPKTDPPKTMTDPPKVETDPPKTMTDPPKTMTDPPKTMTDPPKPKTDPPKTVCPKEVCPLRTSAAKHFCKSDFVIQAVIDKIRPRPNKSLKLKIRVIKVLRPLGTPIKAGQVMRADVMNMDPTCECPVFSKGAGTSVIIMGKNMKGRLELSKDFFLSYDAPKLVKKLESAGRKAKFCQKHL